VHEALQRAELVVVQDATATPRPGAYAHVIPPRPGWGEKEGTMTNRRRISRVRACSRPGGRAADWPDRSMWRGRLGGEGLSRTRQPEEIFKRENHRRRRGGRDLDITGLSYALLDERRSAAMDPFRKRSRRKEKRLYFDTRMAHFPLPRRARFVPTPYRRGGRRWTRISRSAHDGTACATMDSMSRTARRAAFLSRARPRLTMHPDELPGRARQALLAPRRAFTCRPGDADLPPGTVFIPMHCGARFLGGKERRRRERADHRALDPTSRQPDAQALVRAR